MNDLRQRAREAWLNAWRHEIETNPDAKKKFIPAPGGLYSLVDLLQAVETSTEFGLQSAERWLRIREASAPVADGDVPELGYRINCSYHLRLFHLGKQADEILWPDFAGRSWTRQQAIDEILCGSKLGIEIMETMADFDRRCGLASLVPDDEDQNCLDKK